MKNTTPPRTLAKIASQLARIYAVGASGNPLHVTPEIPAGCKGKIARLIKRLRPAPAAPPLQVRFNTYLIDKAMRMITEGGVSTPTGLTRDLLRVVDHNPGATLLGADYWLRYSSRAGSWGLAAKYVMTTGGGIKRVPSTVRTLAEGRLKST